MPPFLTTAVPDPMKILITRLLLAGFAGSGFAGAATFIAVDNLLGEFSGSLTDLGAIGVLLLASRFAYKALTSLSGTLSKGITEADIRAANAEARANSAQIALNEAREETARLRGILWLHNLDPDEGAT